MLSTVTCFIAATTVLLIKCCHGSAMCFFYIPCYNFMAFTAVFMAVTVIAFALSAILHVVFPPCVFMGVNFKHLCSVQTV